MSLRTLISTAVIGQLFCSVLLAAPTARQSGKVGVVDVVIPSNRNDDQYYVSYIDFNEQSIPVLLDTGSGDLFVGSDQCSTTDPQSGCYLSPVYQLDNTTVIVPNETFGTIVGIGGVNGNQSIMSVDFGGVTIDDLAVPLIYYAAVGEFQNGSFGGIFGMSPRNVSRNYYFFNRLPAVEALISEGLLEKPVFSITAPRLGDPDSPSAGKLTFGGIEEIETLGEITYNDIIDSPNYGLDGAPLSPQSWSLELEGVRLNGVEINLTRGLLLDDGRYLSMIDSGAQTISLRPQDFDALAPLFNGPTIFQEGFAVYFDCSIPQLLELRYHGEWFPIDPLDLIIPSNHGVVNGTEMCRSALGSWSRTFADSIMGVPFMRNVISVFDYVTDDLYAVQPRVGLGRLTDGEKALARYPDVYRGRLL